MTWLAICQYVHPQSRDRKGAVPQAELSAQHCVYFGSLQVTGLQKPGCIGAPRPSGRGSVAAHSASGHHRSGLAAVAEDGFRERHRLAIMHQPGAGAHAP